MFELEPGPFALGDPDAMRRLAPRPSFPGLVADGLSDVPGVRAALDGSSSGVVDNPPDDLDGTYAGTIGAAADVVSGDIQPAPPSPTPQLLDAGDGSDRLRTSVAQYLPPSDVPISATFIEPPAPPGSTGEPGRGETPEDRL